MEHIADMVEKEGEDSPWAECFRLCGEDDIVQRLHAAPQKGAMTGWGKSGLKGSSLCSLNPSDLAVSSGKQVTAAADATCITSSKGTLVASITTEDVKKHTLACLTLQAGFLAGILQEAAAIQPVPGDSNKFPSDVCDKESATASSSSSAAPVKAASSPLATAKTAKIKKTTVGDEAVNKKRTGSSPPLAPAVAKKIEKKKAGGKADKKAKGGWILLSAAAILAQKKYPAPKKVIGKRSKGRWKAQGQFQPSCCCGGRGRKENAAE